MIEWHRWLLPGLVVTAVLAVASAFINGPAIERDLVARGERSLSADGQDWASLAASGRVVTLSGTAPSAAAQELARQSVARSWGISGVVDDSGLLPVVKPFTWSATLADQAISIAGHFPSPEARDALQAAMRDVMPTVLISDTTELARGSPRNFDAALGFAVARLAEFTAGSVAISDGELRVSGTARDMSAYTSAVAAARDNVPDGFRIASFDLQPPRAETFVWSATYEDNWITLGGLVTSEAARADLAARARAVIPGVQIADRMGLASGAPESLESAIDYLLGLLPLLSRGKVGLSDRELAVSGTAASVDSYEAILAALAGASVDGYAVAAADVTPAPVSPFVWRAEKTAAGVVLGGYAPSEEERDEAVAAANAAFGGAPLQAGLRVASGEPRMDWIGAIKFAYAQLAKLKTGTVEMSDRSFSIVGEAASSERYAELAATFDRTLPASLRLRRAEVTPPVVSPYRLSAELTADRLLLFGVVPDQAAHGRIVEAAKTTFGDIDIIDELAFGGGAPPDVPAAVIAGLRVLARVSEGKLSLSDRRVFVDGVALNASSIDPMIAAMRQAMPSAYAVEATVRPPPPQGIVSPDECQQLLRTSLAGGTIEFEAGKSAILEKSRRLLDQLAAHLQRCPASLIEIGGHTDSSGGPRSNKALSTDRAEAVVDYLVAIGVLRERLTAVGYGEENPVASNRTEEGRTRNRRIEFNIITPLATATEPAP